MDPQAACWLGLQGYGRCPAPRRNSLQAAAACGPVGRFHQKASLSGELYGRLARISLEWQDLRAGAYQRDEAELREAWRDLSQRSLAIVERAPLDLPLWEDLAERSQREADERWAGRRAA